MISLTVPFLFRPSRAAIISPDFLPFLFRHSIVAIISPDVLRFLFRLSRAAIISPEFSFWPPRAAIISPYRVVFPDVSEQQWSPLSHVNRHWQEDFKLKIKNRAFLNKIPHLKFLFWSLLPVEEGAAFLDTIRFGRFVPLMYLMLLVTWFSYNCNLFQHFFFLSWTVLFIYMLHWWYISFYRQ